MKLTRHPELLERLASSYALGTLRGGARRRFEAMARDQAPVRAAALIWQSRLSSISELQQPIAPDDVVWTRIHNLVQGEKASAAQTAARAQAVQRAAPGIGLSGWLQSLMLWRSAAALGAVAAVAAITMTVATPQIEYVAVLSDDQAGASMLVTFDARSRKLTLQRVGAYQEAGDRSLQLWALPPTGGPKSLGVLGRDKLLHLTAGDSDVREVPMLAISLEPKGGVPSETGPTGPVLFKGAWIQKML